jgi:hypothetical protein
MIVSTSDDINKFSLSERTHAKLKLLQEEGHFLEMRDAFRFGIALALSRKIHPPEIQPPRSAGIYSISQIDPDQSIALAINLLMETNNLSPYRWAERLAEWGIEELSRESEKGQIDFARLLIEAKETTKKVPDSV